MEREDNGKGTRADYERRGWGKREEVIKKGKGRERLRKRGKRGKRERGRVHLEIRKEGGGWG